MRKPSFWTRDILDNTFGSFLCGFVVPAILLVGGVNAIITQEATIRRFSYVGLDAVCIGIGLICLGLTSAVGYNPWLSSLRAKARIGALIIFYVLIVLSFGFAIIRNA